MAMKKLPRDPYLQKIVAEWRTIKPVDPYTGYDYINWLRTHGFSTPVTGDYLEFPDDFSDQDLVIFILKWS